MHNGKLEKIEIINLILMINGIFTAPWLEMLNVNQIKVFFDPTNDSNKTSNQSCKVSIDGTFFCGYFFSLNYFSCWDVLEEIIGIKYLSFV